MISIIDFLHKLPEPSRTPAFLHKLPEPYRDFIKFETPSFLDICMPTYSVYGIFRIKDHELIYIGSTQQSIYARWFFHKSWMSKLYLNHYMKANGGYNDYDVELIDTYDTREDMLEFEKQYISDYKPICNILMNQSFEIEKKERDPYYLPPSIRKKIIDEGKYDSLLPQYKWKPKDVIKHKNSLESQNSN